MSQANAHRRHDCGYVNGCSGCENAPLPGAQNKTFKLVPYSAGFETFNAFRVVDYGRNLVTYQIDTSGHTLVLLPNELPIVRALLAALDEEEKEAQRLKLEWIETREKERREHEFDHDRDECPFGSCDMCANQCSVNNCRELRQGPGLTEFMCVGHDSY